MMKHRKAEEALEDLPAAKRRKRSQHTAEAVAAAAQLPTELLTCVMQHVEQQQRLGVCSLVSRSWHAAALAATTSLAALVRDAHNAQCLSTWLAKRSVHLCSLSLAGLSTVARQQICLPPSQLQQLKHLQLEFLQLPGQGSSSCLQESALSRLTSLRLDRATICSCPDGGGLCCMSALSALQQLHMVSTSARSISQIFSAATQQQQQQQQGRGQGHQGKMAAAAAHVLPQLTQLHLLNVYYADQLPCLSSLCGLKELRLGIGSSEAAANLADLPRSLTRLEVVRAQAMDFSDVSEFTCGFAQLTGLQHLQLCYIDHVQPSLLSGLVQLTQLKSVVWHCGSEQVEQLLQVLPALQQLQVLHLDSWDTWRSTAPNQPRVAAQQLTALLCCRQLNSVVLGGAGWLPAAAGRQLFPAGRQLLGLRRLIISSVTTAVHSPAAADADEEGTNAAAAAVFGADDVTSLACCCPGLQELQLSGVLQQGLAGGVLQQLQQLTGLSRLLLDGQLHTVRRAAASREETG